MPTLGTRCRSGFLPATAWLRRIRDAQIKLSAIVLPLELAGVAAGFVAVASLVYGSALLLRETRIAVQVISERADTVRERFGMSQNFKNL